ncbi:hypothetical protein KFL_001560030 [Klebsormidium nitens]|uniref:Uncharacterized protein n=1 Tax=Klebsormidium nitens TaxID=105231 RepID=A0A1Y1HYA3_KLENI|nr:hypothetical protein KFL_001560030 [Klebsormidium nitens]|eukprot:GAQ83634.1 hypothetical protein KFL_001560030 [Klebsormidium nitens]
MKNSILLVSAVLAVNLMLCEAGCYNSGQWGKLWDMTTAVDKFNEHYHGHAICGAQSLQWVVDAGWNVQSQRFYWKDRPQRGLKTPQIGSRYKLQRVAYAAKPRGGAKVRWSKANGV